MSNGTGKQREIKIGTERREMVKRWSLKNFRSLSSTERGQEARLGRVPRGHEAETASEYSNVGNESESFGREFPQQLQVAMRLEQVFRSIFNTKDLPNLMAYSNLIYNSNNLNSVEIAKGLYYRNYCNQKSNYCQYSQKQRHLSLSQQ